MKFLLKRPCQAWFLFAILCAAWFQAGCASDSPGAAAIAPEAGAPSRDPGRLRNDDLLTISFSGVPNPPEKFEGRIKDDGKVSLPLVGQVQAAGLTPGELEKEVRAKYVGRFFHNLNVTINAESRWFSVVGEVYNRSRQVHNGEMTVLSAIAAAGGFTDFANKKNVQIIRTNGKIDKVNCVRALKNPKLDLPVYPGDRIFVPRRIL